MTLLDLPPEIRLAVYDAYVAVEGGYVLKPQTNKLTPANSNEKHEFALQLTCKKIACEMRGLALRRNTLNFRAEYSNEGRIAAARFHHIQANIIFLLLYFLITRDGDDDIDNDGVPYFTHSIIDEVVKEFPQLETPFRAMLNQQEFILPISFNAAERFGVAPSAFRRGAWRTFQLAIENGLVLDGQIFGIFQCPKRANTLAQDFPPWFFHPTRDEFERLMDNGGMLFRRLGHDYWTKPHVDGLGIRQYTQGRYKFSAAAHAIHYLSHCPQQVRMHIRRIRLYEDTLSVAFPECHALGLIPFCQENPHLYIERHVDIWRTVFRTSVSSSMYPWTVEAEREAALNVEYQEESANGTRLDTKRASRSFALWVCEALELARSGMPKGSFKLVFDGDSAPKPSSQIFHDVIQRDAVWQRVIKMQRDKWTLTEQEQSEKLAETFDFSFSQWYFIDGYPDAIDDMARNRHGLIECSFATKPSHLDPVTEYRKYSYLEPGLDAVFALFAAFDSNSERFVDMPHSLPSWKDLVAEDILPEFFDSDQDVDQVSDADFNMLSSDSDDASDDGEDEEDASSTFGDHE